MHGQKNIKFNKKLILSVVFRPALGLRGHTIGMNALEIKINFMPLPGIDPQFLGNASSHYTDYVIPSPYLLAVFA
jgi:hypothetical protein